VPHGQVQSAGGAKGRQQQKRPKRDVATTRPQYGQTAPELPRLTPEGATLLTAENILRLQRLSGNGAVQRLLDGRQASAGGPIARLQPQVGRVVRAAAPRVQRTALTADEILNAIQRIDFIKQKLAAKVHGVHTDDPNLKKRADLAKRAGAEKPLKDKLERALKAYEGTFKGQHMDKTNNAVMMALAAQHAARVIAEDLYDPGLTPILAKRLLELYRSDIKSALRKEQGSIVGERTKLLDLAQAVASDDPLALYMHKELRAEDAARRIDTMATAAGMNAKKMYGLLRQKFEAEMLSLRQSEVKAEQEDLQLAYGTRETTGETSVAYFKELFGDVEQAAFKDPTKKHQGLKFGDLGQARLDRLSSTVDDLAAGKLPPASTAAETRSGRQLTAKQTEHLKGIEAEEASQAGQLGGIEERIVRTFVKFFEMSADQARTVLEKIKTGLAAFPLTITVWADQWFGSGTPTGSQTQFRPATRLTKKKKESDIFGGKGGTQEIEHSGPFDIKQDVAKERGHQYLQFRKWKDNLMTSLVEMSASEMPTFGAVNVGWESTRGGGDEYGKNYFGNLHYLLKKDRVADRTVYTATDHGKPRRNILLAFADLVLGGSLTGLKDTARLMNIVPQIINAVTNRDPLMADLQFEIQIFGTVDIKEDVERIYAHSSVNDTVKANLAAFTAAGGPPWEMVGAPPPGLKPAAKDMIVSEYRQQGKMGSRAAEKGTDISSNFVYQNANRFLNYAKGLDRTDPGSLDAIKTAFRDLAQMVEGKKPNEVTYDEVQVFRECFDRFKELAKLTGDAGLLAEVSQHNKPSWWEAVQAGLTKKQ
jgi:hypothetical protein